MAASNINRVIITGNLTADPELRSLPSGTSICKLRVACNTRRKDNSTGEWVDKPNYFDVTVWGAQGENCARYLSKGRPVADRRAPGVARVGDPGGQKRQAIDIIADTVQFLSSPRDDARRQRRRLHPALGHPRRHGRLRGRPRRAAARARRLRPTTTSRSRPVELPAPRRAGRGSIAATEHRRTSGRRQGLVRDQAPAVAAMARGGTKRARARIGARATGEPRWTSTTTTR